MTVFGGLQTRPNIHIQDMIRVYQHFLTNSGLPSGCYNAGFENISILDIAKEVSKKVPSEIVVTESIDSRSYRQNSDKILNTGFKPRYNVTKAMEDLIDRYKSGELVDSERCYTVKWMKHLKLDLKQ